MVSIIIGLVAGFVAVVSMSVVMMLAKKAGMMPANFDIALMLGSMVKKNGLPDAQKKIGRLIHLTNGTIFGLLFALFVNAGVLASGIVVQGLLWGVLLWVLMMVIVMPMIGQGLFGLKIAKKVPLLTLVAHLEYGLVLGLIALI